ncbi:heavy metal transport/detoxification protein [Candidatus Pacearchaeota archaeon CG_4_9_14_0_2_um_filter_30_8]|nr:MAG: heavy metal transport/detoxification protein [Candidatus Pacearchaeota archaeon CG_4_9_14_0_2_um_filter_30_8]
MKKKILIEGMTCASCAMNVERSLKKIEGIDEVGVSVLTNKAIVESENEISDDELKKAVSRAGYKTISIE